MKIKSIDTFDSKYGPDNPNPEPGPYWVTVIDGQRFMPLAGPFRMHTQALAQVEACRKFIIDRDFRAHFYNFGTARSDGILKARFNEELCLDETHGIYDLKKGDSHDKDIKGGHITS